MANPMTPLWPELDYEAWRDTRDTLHLWTQIIGKVRLMRTPWLNHSWHVPLYVTATGLTTSPIPHGARTFEIQFDFIEHALDIRSDAGTRRLALQPQSVADFYGAVMAALDELGIAVAINARPCEIEAAIAFSRDRLPCSLRSRVRPALLAGAAANRPCDEAISHGVHRQMQSRAFFLGKLRSRGYALFRPPRPTVCGQGCRAWHRA